MKFVKGKYKIGDDEVPLGTKYLAHANQLTYCWIKFHDGKVVDRKFGRAADRYVPPPREELDDNDPLYWEAGKDGKPQDPWTLQRLLPFEDMETGEVVIFTSSSVGGKIAAEGLARTYAQRVKRRGTRALPIVSIGSTSYRSPTYGEVLMPDFVITGWEDTDDGGREVNFGKDDKPLDDSIPF